MNVLTSAAHVVRLNNLPDRQQPVWKEVANDQRSGQSTVYIRSVIDDEQSSQKTSIQRELLEQRRQQLVTVTVQPRSAPAPIRHHDLPGLPQLEHGVSSSPFLAQQLSQMPEQTDHEDALHTAASNAYQATLQRSRVVLGFQGGSSFIT